MRFKVITFLLLFTAIPVFTQNNEPQKLKPVTPASKQNTLKPEPRLKPMLKDPNAIVPDSIVTRGRTLDYYAAKAQTSHKAIGGNFSIGYGIYNHNIKNYFTNPILLGLDIDLHNRKRIIEFGGVLGLGMSTQNMDFPDETTWEKDNAFAMFKIGASIGYSIVDNRTFLIAPVAGLSLGAQMAVFMNSEAASNEPFLPAYKLGFIYDIKPWAILDDHYRLNDKDISYTSLRISAGVYVPIGRPKYDEFFNGNMVYITIGMGGLTRKYSKY